MASDEVIQEIQKRDGPTLEATRPPLRRAAYSDRMAWQMAVLAQLAYVEFETTPFKEISKLAKELAATNDVKAIEDRLRPLLHLFDRSASSDGSGVTGEQKLRMTLKACGFELVGTFYNQSLDLLKNTEGFVATCDGPQGTYAVLAIRGTTSMQDWIRNVDAKPTPLPVPGGGPNDAEEPQPNIHPGFHEAYKDAAAQMEALLAKVASMPLFITGHSLGGAVAVISTWYLERATLFQQTDRLAACYTFGAPRVGDHNFNKMFHTPVYRVVNSFDPVPMLPPSGPVTSTAKFVIRGLGRFLPGAIIFEKIANFITDYQGYRHAGDLRYITAGREQSDGSFPDVQFFKTFGAYDRLLRMFSIVERRLFRRPDQYHDMTLYRRKLRYYSLKRMKAWDDFVAGRVQPTASAASQGSSGPLDQETP
ncbi:MAG: lipase family protein [Pseudomonadota bacterium]